MNSQLAASVDEAEKAGGFRQAFSPVGDMLDVGVGQKIIQEQEIKYRRVPDVLVYSLFQEMNQ